MSIDINQLGVTLTVDEFEATIETVRLSADLTAGQLSIAASSPSNVEGTISIPTLYCDFLTAPTQPVFTPSLGAPTGLAVTTYAYNGTDGTLIVSIRASWNDMTLVYDNVVGYVVELEDLDNGEIIEDLVVANKQSWFVQPGTNYRVRVKTRAEYDRVSAWSDYETITSATDTTAPDAPYNFTATPLALSILFTWDYSGAPNISFFNLYRNTTNNFAAATLVLSGLGATNSDGMLFYNPPDDTTYYYWLTSVSRSLVESSASNVASTSMTLITEDYLYQDLSDRIDLIDAPGTGIYDRLAIVETDLEQAVIDITTWAAVADDNTAAIQTEQTARINADGVLASSISTVQTTADGNTASIQTNATSINGIEAKYTVKVDVNGYIAGYGLIATDNDGTPTSSFIVLVDEFKIVTPGKTPQVPFKVGTVNSVSTIGIDGQLVVDGSIYARSLNVGTLSAITADVGTLTAGILKNSAGTTYWNLATETFAFGDALSWDGSTLTLADDVLIGDGTNLSVNTNSSIINFKTATGYIVFGEDDENIISGTDEYMLLKTPKSQIKQDYDEALGYSDITITANSTSLGGGFYIEGDTGLASVYARDQLTLNSNDNLTILADDEMLLNCDNDIQIDAPFIYLYANDSGSGNLTLQSDDNIYLKAVGSGDEIQFHLSGNTSEHIHMVLASGEPCFYPGADGTGYIGYPSYDWLRIYAENWYDNGSLFQDAQDDLAVLREIKSASSIDTKTGFNHIDVAALPDMYTNIEDIIRIEKFKDSNMTEKNIRQRLKDPNDLKPLIRRNVKNFLDLTNGAVRQIDRELTDIVVDLHTLIEAQAARIAVLETKEIN